MRTHRTVTLALSYNIGVGAQSTLEGKTFLPENICMNKKA